MNPNRMVNVASWLGSCAALGGIVLVYHRWLHANPTTVALTLILYILLLAARLGLRYAVVISVAATALYNFYFLPPVGTFTIADPQNWLALFAFLATGVVGSRLSEQARDEAAAARSREREVELLFVLSRELLQTENVAGVLSALPSILLHVTRASSVTLYLLEGDRLYQTGLSRLSAAELPHLRQLALGLPEVQAGSSSDGLAHIPLRAGVRPRGLLVLADLQLSSATFQAIGSLVSVALDRAHALESVARAEANKESERLRTLILDSITHELRTPLTSIKGATTTLLSQQHIDQDARHELLTIVDEEADRLNHLVSQAVEMAQIEAQEVHMNIAPVALADIVASARESCSWVASSHALTVTLPSLPPVAADSSMVSKVLCNLLENAGKYSAPGTPIFISAEQRDGRILTSIADRGAGIDPSEQTLIFDRLYRSRRDADSTAGTGMGLAISRAIIESHHGELTVTSQLGHGSVFTFSLPVAGS